MCFGQIRSGRIIPSIMCLWFVVPLQAAQVHVSVGGEGKTAGSTITIPIVVSADVTVGAAQLELVYDPARLRWVGGDAGKLTANTLIDANLIEPGHVKIAFAGGEDVTGTGTIYQATFEWADSQSGPASLGFAGVRAWDQATGFELSTSALPGEVAPGLASPAKSEPDRTALPPTAVVNYGVYAAVALAVLFAVAAVIVMLRKKPGN